MVSLYAREISATPQQAPLHDARWYVLTTFEAAEYAVARRLQRHGMGAWFPKARLTRSTRWRMWVELLPYAPGYVFVTSVGKRWRVVRETAGVTGVLGSDGHPMPIRAGEMERLMRQLTALGGVAGAVPIADASRRKPLKVGERGSFADDAGWPAGREGLVIVVEDGEITLSLDILGRAVPVKRPEAQVIPA